MTTTSVTSCKKAISEVPGRFCVDSNSEKSDPKIQSGRPCLFRKLFSQQHPSGRGGNTVRMPISVKKLRTVQVCIRPDVMATRPDALQSVRRFQCSNTSVRTTWLYRPDASQSSRRKMISFANTDM